MMTIIQRKRTLLTQIYSCLKVFAFFTFIKFLYPATRIYRIHIICLLRARSLYSSSLVDVAVGFYLENELRRVMLLSQFSEKSIKNLIFFTVQIAIFRNRNIQKPDGTVFSSHILISKQLKSFVACSTFRV